MALYCVWIFVSWKIKCNFLASFPFLSWLTPSPCHTLLHIIILKLTDNTTVNPSDKVQNPNVAALMAEALQHHFFSPRLFQLFLPFLQSIPFFLRPQLSCSCTFSTLPTPSLQIWSMCCAPAETCWGSSTGEYLQTSQMESSSVLTASSPFLINCCYDKNTQAMTLSHILYMHLQLIKTNKWMCNTPYNRCTQVYLKLQKKSNMTQSPDLSII